MRLWILVGLLAVCGCTRLSKPDVGPTALVIANCPALGPVMDETFGGTVQALIETSIQYNKCREAALAGQK